MQCLLRSPFSFKDWLASVFTFWTLVGAYMEYWIVLCLSAKSTEWRMENGEWMVLVDWCERRGLIWNIPMLFPSMLLALSPFMTFQITTEPFVKKSSIFAYTSVHSHQVTIASEWPTMKFLDDCTYEVTRVYSSRKKQKSDWFIFEHHWGKWLINVTLLRALYQPIKQLETIEDVDINYLDLVCAWIEMEN